MSRMTQFFLRKTAQTATRIATTQMTIVMVCSVKTGPVSRDD